jgi:hypothetical protein
MKKIIAICFLLIAAGNTFGQQITFQKILGGTGSDGGNSVQQTTDNGYIIIGTTNSFGAGSFDIYLIKTDADGNILWTKTYGGTNNDYGNSVYQTTDGGYIMTGLTYSFGVMNSDVYLIKTDANGNLLWTKTYGGAGDDRANAVQQTPDGGYIVSGWTNSFGAIGQDIYLIKTDSNGNPVWTKTLGGGGNDVATSLQQSLDAGYYSRIYKWFWSKCF